MLVQTNLERKRVNIVRFRVKNVNSSEYERVSCVDDDGVVDECDDRGCDRR